MNMSMPCSMPCSEGYTTRLTRYSNTLELNLYLCIQFNRKRFERKVIDQDLEEEVSFEEVSVLESVCYICDCLEVGYRNTALT